MSRIAAALAAAALLAALPARATPPFLGVVDVDAPGGLGAPPLTVALVLRDARPEQLDELRARFGSVELDGERVRFGVRGYAPRPDAPAERDRASTWIVDHAEPAVQKLRPEVVRAAGPSPRVDDLVRFVAAFITRKDLSRGYDPASVVATRRQGDCTEHAALLAALCRMFGIPARVVNGFVLLTVEGHAAGFGHAWAEAFEDGAWRLADATDIAPLHPVYLPIDTLRDDGPGFLLSGNRLGFLDLVRIEVAPAPPPR